MPMLDIPAFINTECSPVIIVDDFLREPEKWREQILALPEGFWFDHDELGRVADPTFLRDQITTFELMIGHLLRQVCTLTAWFSLRLDNEPDILNILDTSSLYDYFGVLYLSHSAPNGTGTVFLEHKKRLRELTYDNLYFDEFEGLSLQEWSVYDTIANIYNRMVLFPGGRIARVLSGFGSSVEDGGLVQIFDVTRSGRRSDHGSSG